MVGEDSMAVGFAMQDEAMVMAFLDEGLVHGLSKDCLLCSPWLFSSLPLLFEPSNMGPLFV